MPDIEIDDDTFEWLQRSAAAEGITIDEFLLELVKRDKNRLAVQHEQDELKTSNEHFEPPIGIQMAKLFGEIGLRDNESIPELKQI